MDRLTERMGSEPILPVKQSVTIDTMLNFDGHREATCKQTLTVGCAPSAAVAASGGSAQAVYIRERGVPRGICLGRGRVSALGCLPGRVYTSPRCGKNDRHLWYHYLSSTTVADGKNRNHFTNLNSITGPWWRWNGVLEATGPMLMKRMWTKWNKYDDDNTDEILLAGKMPRSTPRSTSRSIPKSTPRSTSRSTSRSIPRSMPRSMSRWKPRSMSTSRSLPWTDRRFWKHYLPAGNKKLHSVGCVPPVLLTVHVSLVTNRCQHLRWVSLKWTILDRSSVLDTVYI